MGSLFQYARAAWSVRPFHHMRWQRGRCEPLSSGAHRRAGPRCGDICVMFLQSIAARRVLPADRMVGKSEERHVTIEHPEQDRPATPSRARTVR